MRRVRAVWTPSAAAEALTAARAEAARRMPPRLRIPRMVHQVAIDCVLPPEILSNLEAIRTLNPGWECRLYDSPAVVSFILTHFGQEMLDTYESINPQYGAARADLFRYLVLYKLGGVYLDLKSRAGRPLDDVIRPDDRFLLSQWENRPGMKFEGWGLHKELRLKDGEFQQWFIIAAPGHPFLQAVIRRVVRNINGYVPALHGAGRLGVLRTTGPIPYTLAIGRLLASCAHRIVRSEAELGLEYSIYLDIDYTSKSTGHYSQVTAPVARGAHRPLLSGAVQGLKTARSRLRRLSAAWPGLSAARAEKPILIDRGTALGRIAPDSPLRKSDFAERTLR